MLASRPELYEFKVLLCGTLVLRSKNSSKTCSITQQISCLDSCWSRFCRISGHWIGNMGVSEKTGYLILGSF